MILLNPSCWMRYTRMYMYIYIYIRIMCMYISIYTCMYICMYQMSLNIIFSNKWTTIGICSYHLIFRTLLSRSLPWFGRAQRCGVLRLGRLPAQVGGQRLRRWHPAAVVPRRERGRIGDWFSQNDMMWVYYIDILYIYTRQIYYIYIHIHIYI